MNLYLIENDKTIDKILSSPLYSPGHDNIVCLNYLCYLRLKKEEGNHTFVFVEDLLTEEDYEELHSSSDRFARTWYMYNGVDQTLHNGVSYGELVEPVFSRKYMISILVKYGEVIRKAFKKWPYIKLVYYDLSNSENFFCVFVDDRGKFFNKQLLVQTVCNQLKIKTYYIEAEKPIPSAIFAFIRTPSVIPTFKQKLISLTLSILTKLINHANSLQKQKNKTYFFHALNLYKLVSYGAKYLILPALTKDILRPRILFSGPTFLNFEQIQHEFDNNELSFLQKLDSRLLSSTDALNIECDFNLNGINYREIYKTAIKDILSNTIPNLLRYIGQVRLGIKKFNISQIILNDTLDEKCRATIKACGLEDIKSIFVDHGIVGHACAQKAADRFKPDVLITPSSFNPYCFALDPLPLGNPSMDPYTRNKRKRISSIKKVLFLTYEDNFYARLDRFAYQEKYYKEIFSTFDRLIAAGIEIFYRPHYENIDYHRYLFDFFGIDISRINYVNSNKTPFPKSIYKMDLMVCNVSNCFFEAQAAGVPTIFFEPHFNKNALLPPFNGAHGKEVLRVSTGKELLQLILNNQNDPKYLNDFLDNFLEKHAPLYMGNLDGMASKRIIEFVCNKNESLTNLLYKTIGNS